jgi:hypothetical protein
MQAAYKYNKSKFGGAQGLRTGREQGLRGVSHLHVLLLQSSVYSVDIYHASEDGQLAELILHAGLQDIMMDIMCYTTSLSTALGAGGRVFLAFTGQFPAPSLPLLLLLHMSSTLKRTACT